MRKKVLSLSENVVFRLSVVLMGFFTVVSLISTTYFKVSDLFPETPEYRFDNIILNIILAAAAAAVLFLLCGTKLSGRISTSKTAAAAAVAVILIGIVWINVSGYYPASDQLYVSTVAYQASIGNFKQFEAGGYMQIYPNQLGMVAVLEVIYRITGGENWIVFQYITAVSNGFTVWLLYKITHKLFNNKKTDLIVIFLSLFCAQLLFYTTYVYGISPGLTLALAAFYQQLLFIENGRFHNAFLSGAAIGIAVLLKNNYSIFLVAMVILALYKALEKKSIKMIAEAVLAVVISFILSAALTSVYEIRTGEDIGDGMPKILWVAMGMQEGERAEGWYNGFNYDTFTENDADAEISTELAWEAIDGRISDFVSNPLYAAEFYYKKIVSQWNEPTYESMWANQFHEGDFSVVVQSIYEGKLYIFFQEYMNIYQLVIFSGMFICLVFCRKNLSMEKLFLPMVIIGGFIFHILWEAKSGYIFPYFMCMLPAAAAGLSEAFRVFEIRVFAKRRTADK